MIETLVPQIVKALREISEWPWEPTQDNSSTVTILDATGELRVLVYPKRDTEIKLGNRDFIASSPLWLAQMVVALVEERCFANASREKWRKEALHDFSLTPDDWTWLKGKVGE